MATMSTGSFSPLQGSLLLALIALGMVSFAFTASRVLNLRIRWLPRWLRLRQLSDLFLSADIQQKQIGRRFLMGAANCAAGVLALNVCAANGLIDQRASGWLTLTAALLMAFFYVLMRSGLNKRFKDPALLSGRVRWPSSTWPGAT